jgi:hypothetical protein
VRGMIVTIHLSIFLYYLVSINISIKMYRTVMLPFHFCGQEGLKLKVSENRVQRGKWGCEKLVVAGVRRKYRNEECHN